MRCLTGFQAVGSSLQQLAQFSKFRILTPLRTGPLGVEQLNAQLYNRLFATSRQGIQSIPIMIAKNDYRLDLFNGEMGLLVRSFKNGSHYAIFPGRENGTVRKVAASLLPPFEYAYALSIHKSQGSEFETVILLLPEGCEQFGREALYTGITRARRSIEVWGEINAMQRMVQKSGMRLSGLRERGLWKK